MGQIRTAFRAYSLIEGSPEKVVARLDCLMSDLDPEHFSTMIYLVWDPAEGTARTVVAGHPPPLLIDAAGQAEFLGGDVSVPLGTMAGFPYRHLRTSVENGSTLVLYTDGLVEQEGGVEKGLANLKRAASYPADSPDELCDRLLKSMLPADSEDDVAVVVLRFLAE
jgi:serine phosphatase RsbU (regulator of sigma subunit)